MKALPWILAGITAGLAYAIINQPKERYATGDPDLDAAANKTSIWGSNKRVTGISGSLLGKAKQGIGNATGNDKLAAEGIVDEVTGTVKDAAGKAAHAVSDTIRDLNR